MAQQPDPFAASTSAAPSPSRQLAACESDDCHEGEIQRVFDVPADVVHRDTVVQRYRLDGLADACLGA